MSQFENETRVEMTGPGVFEGTVSPCWNIGENPNGGYLLSIVSSALSQAVPHPDPLTFTTHYLRPGSPGKPCRVEVDLIRTGRSVSTARATLIQDDKERLVVLAAFTDLSSSAGVDSDLTEPPVELPTPDECVARDGDAQGVTLPIRERLDVRIDPAYMVPGRAPAAEIRGWVRYRDGTEPSVRSLLMFSDTFPPSPFGVLGNVGWVPTLELTVHVRRRPAPGWIRARLRTDDLTGGRMIESGWLWDSTGALVAQSRQVGLVMNGGGT